MGQVTREAVWLAVRLSGVAAAVLVPLTIGLDILQPSVVRGASMVPTLHDGERILVERMIPLFGSLLRDDVVVLAPPGNDGERYVKRIAALPGDVVRIESGRILVGEDAIVSLPTGEPEPRTIVVPEGSCFVLGDNFERSFDSRAFGTVPLSRVIGRVVGR